MNSGKIVIVVVFAVGLGLAVFSWLHRWQASQQVLEFWGGEAAYVIRTGKKVELLRIGPAIGVATDLEGFTVGNRRYCIIDQFDISKAPGLIHARHHLLHEKGFIWEALGSGGDTGWEYAFRFTKGDSVATMAFDFERQRARLIERDREVSMAPISAALRKFVVGLIPRDVSVTTTQATGQE